MSLTADAEFMRPRLVPVIEAGRMLGIGRTSAFELVRSKRLDSVLLCGRRLIPTAAIDRLVAELLADAGPAGSAASVVAADEH